MSGVEDRQDHRTGADSAVWVRGSSEEPEDRLGEAASGPIPRRDSTDVVQQEVASGQEDRPVSTPVAGQEFSSAGPNDGAVRFSGKKSFADFSCPGDLGQRLVNGIFLGDLPNGMEMLFHQVKHFASTDAFSRHQGIFPLPVQWQPVSSLDDPCRAPGVQAWLSLTCHALNLLSGCKKTAPAERTGKRVTEVVEGLRTRVERFLALFQSPARVDPDEVWKDVIDKKLSYDGEECLEPLPVTTKQILKSLPPVGHGGSVELLPLLVGKTRHLLGHPEEILLSAREKEPGSNRAKVHIDPQ